MAEKKSRRGSLRPRLLRKPLPDLHSGEAREPVGQGRDRGFGFHSAAQGPLGSGRLLVHASPGRPLIAGIGIRVGSESD